MLSVAWPGFSRVRGIGLSRESMVVIPVVVFGIVDMVDQNPPRPKGDIPPGGLAVFQE